MTDVRQALERGYVLGDMADGAVGMPEVDVPPDLEERFAKAWRVASGHDPASPDDGGEQRHIVIVTPGRMLMSKPCPRPRSMKGEAVQAIEKIAASAMPLRIAVIAFTQLDRLMKNLPDTIPFAGYLLGLAYVGHTVVVFEGHPSALRAGSRGADMLIVDEAMVPHLQKDWATTAWSALSGSQILVFGRNGTLGRVVKKSAT